MEIRGSALWTSTCFVFIYFSFVFWQKENRPSVPLGKIDRRNLLWENAPLFVSGAKQGLSYLKDLGVGTVWLSSFHKSTPPLTDFAVIDFKSVHPQFGTLADFQDFIAEAKSLGNYYCHYFPISFLSHAQVAQISNTFKSTGKSLLLLRSDVSVAYLQIEGAFIIEMNCNEKISSKFCIENRLYFW